MRTLFTSTGVALLASLASLATAAPAAETITRRSADGWTAWRVERPRLQGERTPYPAIVLHPGDEVRVQAGGCLGDGLAALDFASAALVHVPGVTGGLTPVAQLAREDLRIPDDMDPAGLTLALGVDREGTGARLPGCAGLANAFFEVAVRGTGGTNVAPAPMDLVTAGGSDPNWMWLNPRWGVQQNVPGSLGDPKACFNLSGWFNNPGCTVQRPGIDEPTGLTWLICYAGSTTPIEGHVNWYPSTYTGPVYWSDQSWPDMDYNINIVPPNRNGLTRYNTTTIHTEFDARETIDHFVTPWWNAFRGASDATKSAMINGREAVIAGLVGTDCEHDCYSEIHPVWALAVHVKNDPNDDVWAILARNFGNEGFCSRYQHLVAFSGNRFTFNFPWRAGATSVATTSGTGFYANLSGMSWSWGSTPGQKVSLTVQLLSPYSYPRVHGELHLRWTGTSLRAGDVPPDTAEPEAWFEQVEEGGPAERWAEGVLSSLSPEQRRQLEYELARTAPGARDASAMPGFTSAQAEEATQLSEATPVTAVPDPATARGNVERLLALRRAYGSRLPGQIGAIIDRYQRSQQQR